MPEEAKAPKKSKAMLFVVMGAVLVMLILVGVIVFLFMSKSAEPNEGASRGGGVAAQQMRNAQMNNNNADESSLMVRSSDYLSLGPLYPLAGPFVVNLISQNGRRYLKASVSLELNDSKLLEEIKNKETAIRDTIIEILSSKTVEEITTLKGKNKLKEEIRSNVNSFLIDGFIKNVFFTDFVIQ
ncbi:flagellar basal body-associated protein FliL [Helicobacter cynogastricus]|uniref:flagellar basal body-associated protein FliL n=1 Tax=Helicobacter cynogastricus TaxID=329937 RepID=UPI000CF108E8|nr:flagellar basal body-associated protein FliL [Helicobacter cynogastricus]